MANVRTTVLTLERQEQAQQARSLAELHAAYDRLAGLALTAARGRGYQGRDPMEAVQHLAAERPLDQTVARACGDLWLTFFSCFRADEKGFELARMKELAGSVNRRLAHVPPGGAPDGALARDILVALEEMWQARQEALSGRLDQLIADLSQHQRRLGSVELEHAASRDELGRIRQVLDGLAGELGLAADQPPAVRLGACLERLRADAAAARERSEGTVRAFGAFLQAIRSAARGQQPPALPAEAQAVVDEVRRLDDARRDLERLLREAHAEAARAGEDRRRIEQESAERAARLNRLSDHGPGADERLALYRQAFAAIETGGDPAPILSRIRAVERVVPLAAAGRARLVKALDRHLGEVFRVLAGLRDGQALIEDPRRFRPRLLGGGAYAFDTPGGQARALTDAARDLEAFAARARWAVGAGRLAKAVPQLRAVFRELVSLIAAWRQRLGDPPPVSISINIDSGSGVLALPGVVAADLEGVMKRKAKAGPAAAELAPLIEQCVALYHAALARALDDLPPRSQPQSKRESPLQAVTRLAAELARLAALCEDAFADAARADFRLAAADQALLDDDHPQRLGLQHIDEACAVLAALPNAPALPGQPAAFPALPSRGEPAVLLVALRARRAWLELMATYRFVSHEAST